MLKIAICDDEPMYINQLSLSLNACLKTYSETFEIVPFSSGYHLIEVISKSPNYFDIIFLDNIMPDINGIDTAKNIRHYNQTVPLVFVTITKDYAFESFKVKAHQYLLKPLNEAQLDEILREILITLPKEIDACFTINQQNQIYRIPLSNIYYFESRLRKITAYTTTGEVIFYDKLSNIESQLSADGFIRCHQSYLINMNYVYLIKNNTILLSNQTELPISKKYQSTIKEQFMNHLNTQLGAC